MPIVVRNRVYLAGDTGDRSVRAAGALHQAGHEVWVRGPSNAEYSRAADELGLKTCSIRAGGLRRWLLSVQIARLLNQQGIQILHARHGSNYWLTVGSAWLSRVRPKVVLFRHLAKSPGSYVSRRFLHGQSDAMITVSGCVAKVLRQGAHDPASPAAERPSRPP